MDNSLGHVSRISAACFFFGQGGQGWDAGPSTQFTLLCAWRRGSAACGLTAGGFGRKMGFDLKQKKKDKLRHSYVSPVLKKVQSGIGSRQRRALDFWCCRMLWLSRGTLWSFPALFMFSLPCANSQET